MINKKNPKIIDVVGILLILFIGLMNFHFPHFLLEKHTYNFSSYVLEYSLLLVVLAALVSAVGIYIRRKWGWKLGVLVIFVSLLLWIAQETIGLPGLPKMWFEPSRIVSIIVEIVFIYLTIKNKRLGRA